MVTAAGLRPVLTDAHPHWDSREARFAANGCSRVVWDPVAWVQAQAARRPDDFEFRVTEAHRIVDALAPLPGGFASDESMLSRLVVRRYLVHLLVIAAEIETDVAAFGDWLRRPSERHAAAAHFARSLSAEALDYWHSVLAFGFTATGRALHDPVVDPVLAVVRTHLDQGRPPLLPGAPSPIWAETIVGPDPSGGALYLRTAACHLNSVGLTVHSFEDPEK